MGTNLESRLRDAFASVARTHQPDVDARLAEFQARSTGTGAPRRVRLIVAPLVATTAIVAIILGTAYLLADPDERATPLPAGRPTKDPWAPPSADPRNPQPFGAGERLELIQTERETVAVTAAVVTGALCVRAVETSLIDKGRDKGRTGANTVCQDPFRWRPDRGVSVLSGIATDVEPTEPPAGWRPTEEKAVRYQILWTHPDAVRVAWHTRSGVSYPKVHRVGGFPNGIVVLPKPSDTAPSTLQAFDAAGKPLLKPFTIRWWSWESHEQPSSRGGTPLLDYDGRTLTAVLQGNRVQVVGTHDGETVDTFSSAPAVPSAPVEEIGLDRVFLGARWVAGTMRADVTRVEYRLAAGTRLPTQVKQLANSRARMWYVRLPDDRLNKPPANGDAILAYGASGLIGEVKPRF